MLRTGTVVLMAAHTHLAVHTLVRRLRRFVDSFAQEATRQGLEPPPVIVTRVYSSDPPPDADGIRNFPAAPCVTLVNRWLREGVLLIGGTTSAILKMAEELSQRQPFARERSGFQAEVLVVDEASMMLFPHFLSLASIVRPEGQILLAGDNRQLAPIAAHDWEQEDRPPMQYYQPFNSSYDAVLRIINDAAIDPAANEYTCQGLELDYVGVCWDGDLRWDDAATAWKPCRLIGSRWQTVSNADAKRWAINKYRVLLTRARIGSIIWVPEGSTGRSDTEFRGSR
jgi:Uncharacterized conserved protein (DUF2075)